MKFIFVNRFFHPDHSATSQMLSDLAFALAARGRAAVVIASRQRYDTPAGKLPPRELIDGVDVHRVWTTHFGRGSLPGRAIDYATFYLSAAWRLWRLARAGDVVVAKTDPPMLSVIAGPLCRQRGARLVNWLQDIFPETAQALGVGGRAARAPFRLLGWLRSRSLQRAHMNVVLGPRMAERVARLGAQPDRIRIIPNWADGAGIAPVEPAANPLRWEWQLGDAFVVGYSGNLGRAHEIDTVLEAMTILEMGRDANGHAAPPSRRANGSLGPPGNHQPRRQVVWLFIGAGVQLDALKAEVERRRLTSVRFKPYQPRERLAESLSAADVHLVSLRPALEGLIVPSKVYGIAAAGRPTIFVGHQDGEIARLLARHACGTTVASGDGAGLARAITSLAADPDLCRQMGRQARQAFDTEFDKTLALERWESLLLDVARPACRGG